MLDTGHSRFPVRGAEGVDDLIGVVGIADVLGVPPAERARTRIDAVAVPPLLVPETLPLPTVLDRLRSGHRQLACVVDEYGGFAGVITLEDLAEELVGPIRDEDDPPDRAPARQEDGSWVVPARWRIDEVADSTGIELPEAPEYDTLSGLVMRELGRVPEVGDRLEIALAGDGDEPLPSGPRVLVEVLAVGPARRRLGPAPDDRRRGRGGCGMSPGFALIFSVVLWRSTDSSWRPSSRSSPPSGTGWSSPRPVAAGRPARRWTASAS